MDTQEARSEKLEVRDKSLTRICQRGRISSRWGRVSIGVDCASSAPFPDRGSE